MHEIQQCLCRKLTLICGCDKKKLSLDGLITWNLPITTENKCDSNDNNDGNFNINLKSSIVKGIGINLIGGNQFSTIKYFKISCEIPIQKKEKCRLNIVAIRELVEQPFPTKLYQRFWIKTEDKSFVQGCVFFNIFIIDMDNRLENIIIKFTENTQKMGQWC